MSDSYRGISLDDLPDCDICKGTRVHVVKGEYRRCRCYLEAYIKILLSDRGIESSVGKLKPKEQVSKLLDRIMDDPEDMYVGLGPLRLRVTWAASLIVFSESRKQRARFLESFRIWDIAYADRNDPEFRGFPELLPFDLLILNVGEGTTSHPVLGNMMSELVMQRRVRGRPTFLMMESKRIVAEPYKDRQGHETVRFGEEFAGLVADAKGVKLA